MEFDPTTKQFSTTPDEQFIVGLNAWSLNNASELTSVLHDAMRRNADIDLQRFPASAQNTELRHRQHKDARLIAGMLNVIATASTDPLMADIYTLLDQEQ